MGSYILCQVKKASTPFYIENISTNIYTIEELCYYLYNNLYLLDQTIVNEELANWLEQELGLVKLAAKLKPHLGKFASEEDILYPIFKEINYLTYEELKQLNVKLSKMNTQTAAMREKCKADLLVRNGMYVKAIQVYRKLLEKSDLDENDEQLPEKIYHNLGCAYSYLFQMENALDCFKKEYEISKTDEALKMYLIAYKTVRTPLEYESLLSELKVSENVLSEIEQALERFARIPEKSVYSQHVDEGLREIMSNYHRSTGSYA
ncbi:MAG: hypothetical protein Q4B47_00870 [Eubacteriales bacterium]|nr:hypothetical protein [Eubacteriales bacterium]